MSNTTRYRATALSQVLKDQGRYQRWLATRIGLTEATLSRIVNGLRPATATEAEAIAARLDVPLFLIFELADGSASDAHGRTAA